MKIRFIIYSSLLFVTLALPVIYKSIDSHLQKQEISFRQQKKDLLIQYMNMELGWSKKATNRYMFWLHYKRALDYFLLYLEMAQEDINNIKNSSAFLKLVL